MHLINITRRNVTVILGRKELRMLVSTNTSNTYVTVILEEDSTDPSPRDRIEILGILVNT